MISMATQSTVTIKNVAHLTNGIKFNVSFMRNSFYKKFDTLTTFLATLLFWENVFGFF